MMDLNDLQVFEKVASLSSFSGAARALELPKSSVSRSIARLEAKLGTRLLERTTRRAVVTEAGALLRDHCAAILGRVDEAVALVSGFATSPRGQLRISAGVGFGIHVLGAVLPRFADRYREIEISLVLGNRSLTLVENGIDVAIHMGPLADSGLISFRLGAMGRYLCCSPGYIERRGRPLTIDDLRDHERIETPADNGRPRGWTLSNPAGAVVRIEDKPRLTVNETATIHQLLMNDGGIGVLSGFICEKEFASGRLVHLLPEWTMPPLEVNVVHTSSRALSPAVRAFIDFLRTSPEVAKLWLKPNAREKAGPDVSDQVQVDRTAIPMMPSVKLSVRE